MKRVSINIKGIVQGVGMRPFIYNLAQKFFLTGFIFNHSGGVDIEIQGEEKSINKFIREIKSNHPSSIKIDSFSLSDKKVVQKEKLFKIKSSRANDEFQQVSPDLGVCKNCLNEFYDKKNRRYLYPFINCTSCGPRFTIINDLPYDRDKTTMATFKMCKECSREYNNPQDRRFHAQPISCPSCGPRVWARDKNNKNFSGKKALEEAARWVMRGGIVALKGVGGFHLICDLRNKNAVETLRKLKSRLQKPFALMVKNTSTLENNLFLTKEENILLDSPISPIVLLNKKESCSLCELAAPGVPRVGVIKPYTPMHELLFHYLKELSGKDDHVLVCTSGNISGEPVIKDNKIATKYLSFADLIVYHNREILLGYDDSIVVHHGSLGLQVIRAARGMSPVFIKLPVSSKEEIIVSGSDFKTTFCLVKKDLAIRSQYLGDFDTLRVKIRYEQALAAYKKLFKVSPKKFLCDLHPDYKSRSIVEGEALKQGKRCVFVQHHKAHVASVCAEHGIKSSVIGVVFDGTGYGEDQRAWGGEFFYGRPKNLKRVASSSSFTLPGGDKASKNPWRVAFSLLSTLSLPTSIIKNICKEDKEFVKEQLHFGINCFETSSIGRLFDGVSSILNICHKNTYEGEAPMKLERVADGYKEVISSYRFSIINDDGFLSIDWRPVIMSVVEDVNNKKEKGLIAKKFMNAIVNMIVEVVGSISKEHKEKKVILSGGVFQNEYILKNSVNKLSQKGYKVYLNKSVPPGDGCISLGQAYIGALEG